MHKIAHGKTNYIAHSITPTQATTFFQYVDRFSLMLETVSAGFIMAKVAKSNSDWFVNFLFMSNI